MLTKEQVVEIIDYCNDNNISRNIYLNQLGIKKSTFYHYFRKYNMSKKQIRTRNSDGEFVLLENPSPAPNPPQAVKQAKSDERITFMSITTSDGCRICLKGRLSMDNAQKFIKEVKEYV